MAILQIITAQEVIENCNVDRHFDRYKLEPNINAAQFRWGQEFLGKDFFNELNTQKNDDSFTDKNDELWNQYLIQYFAYAVLYESRMNINWSVSTQGFMSNNTEFSQSDSNAIKAISELLKTRLDTLQRQIDVYLVDNKDDFPLYPKNITTSCGASLNDVRQYFGVNLDNDKTSCCE